MPPISRSRFVWYLGRLSADEFAAFVADLWSARGWSTEVREDVVVATREEPTPDRQALLVRHAAPLLGGVEWTPDRGGLTHVVTSGPASEPARETARSLDADLLDRGDLYDMAVYALAHDVREALFQEHFGRSATVPERSGVASTVVSRLGSRRGMLVALAIVLVLAAATAGGSSLLGGETIDETDRADVPTIDTLTPESFEVPQSTPTVAPVTPTPTATFVSPTPPPGMPTANRTSNEVPGAGSEAWRMFRGDVARTGHRPATDGPVGEVGVLARFSSDGPIGASPVVVDGTVYVGSQDGSLYALDALNLTVTWQRPLAGSIVSSAATSNGTVYVGSIASLNPGAPYERRSNRRMHAIDAANAAIKWNAATESITTSSPAVVNDTVYVGSTNGNVYALHAGTGSARWNTSTEDGVVGSPAVANGTVYVGSRDGRVYALDAANGTIRWRVPTEDQIISTPAVANGTVYVGSLDGHVYAIDARNGTVTWRHRTGDRVFSSPAVANGTVYVGSADRNVYALDAATGREQWIYPTDGRVIASPAVANGTVYVGSEDGFVYALDADSGDERWAFDLVSGIHSSPAVVDDVVYVGTNGGFVFALAETEGE